MGAKSKFPQILTLDTYGLMDFYGQLHKGMTIVRRSYVIGHKYICCYRKMILTTHSLSYPKSSVAIAYKNQKYHLPILLDIPSQDRTASGQIPKIINET